MRCKLRKFLGAEPRCGRGEQSQSETGRLLLPGQDVGTRGSADGQGWGCRHHLALSTGRVANGIHSSANGIYSSANGKQRFQDNGNYVFCLSLIQRASFPTSGPPTSMWDPAASSLPFLFPSFSHFYPVPPCVFCKSPYISFLRNLIALFVHELGSIL